MIFLAMVVLADWTVTNRFFHNFICADSRIQTTKKSFLHMQFYYLRTLIHVLIVPVMHPINKD